jgi:uncharacterized protein
MAMAQKADIIDLSRVAPSPGDGRRIDVDVAPGRLSYGDQAYEVAGATAPARLDVSRTTAGYALRLRFASQVAGPCVRCLEPAAANVEVDAREVELGGSAEDSEEDLHSPYVSEDELDLTAWAHDALALAMPGKFLCRPDCAGLCPVCGESLNDADPAEHRHEQAPDPRWDKLRELKLD